jgi:hypothetical protein
MNFYRTVFQTSAPDFVIKVCFRVCSGHTLESYHFSLASKGPMEAVTGTFA